MKGTEYQVSEGVFSLTTLLTTACFSLQNSVKKYNLKMSKDGKDYEEEIEIDTEKETETFHVPKTSDEEEAADMIYDFKKVSKTF